MTFDELLVELDKRGVEFKKFNADLFIRGGREVLDLGLKESLRIHKQALLDLLGQDIDQWWPTPLVIMPEMLPLVTLNAEQIAGIVSQVPGGASNVQDIYPLAPLQEGIFFHYLMADQGDPYLSSGLMAFDSRERLNGYMKAMQAVVDRHDILRTAIFWEGLPEPVQVVLRRVELPVEEVELSEEGDAVEQLYVRLDLCNSWMDLRQAPMLRLHMAYDARQNRWLLLMLSHHLTTDHVSLELLLEEVGVHLQGEAATLAAPVPFRNYVAQARLGMSREEHEIFFRRMLGDVKEPTAPFGLLEVQGDGAGIAETHLELPAALSGRMRERARQLGVSTASLCHLAWAQVLSRVSGHDDVVFGTVLFGRMQGDAGAAGALGLYINTLPVRIRIEEQSVVEGVRQAQQMLAELLRHEHASLALAQRCSAVPAPAPLFSSLLNYRHSREVGLSSSQEAVPGMTWLRAEDRTNYPFELSIDDLGDGFHLTAQTASSIDPGRICAFMETTLASLVEALEGAPETPLRNLVVLPAAEREQVLYGWNATGTEFRAERCVHELFEEQVERTPEATALVFQDEELSYRELNVRANGLAHYLSELGVKPDERVAICVERSFEMVIAVLAVLKAGGAYVPLDPAYPLERLQFMVEDSEPVAVLTQKHLAGVFTAGSRPERVVLMLDDKVLAWNDYPATNLDCTELGLNSSHLAYVIYTSGSTGTPKGVSMQHEALTNLLCWQNSQSRFYSAPRTLQFAALGFDVSFQEMFSVFSSGGVLVLISQEERLVPYKLLFLLEKERVQRLFIPPVLLQLLVEALAARGRAAGEEARALSIDFPVEEIITAGEQLRIDPCLSSLLGRLTQCRLQNHYGPSETHVVTAFDVVSEAGDFPVLPPIGKPIANTQIYILDSYGEPVPIGVSGELYIGGTGVARGYLNRPELTAERFVSDPFSSKPAARMYRTGDLGRWLPDGNIEFLGRNDDQVKIRGFRIELGEIEAKLSAYPGLREAVVVAREDTPGDKRLVAYYISTKEEETFGADSLRFHLQQMLPEYMVPAAYVRLESMPLTPNGKLDRKALPVPDAEAYVVRGYEAPQGEMEVLLAEAFAEVLGVERVGRHDNFFELGGHSLLAVRVISRLQRGLKIEIRISELFTHPVLSALATSLQSAIPVELPSIAVTDRSGPLPLSFAQQRLWFLEQLEGISEAYHIPFGLRLKGHLRGEALSQALDRIRARHEALRTTFAFIDEQPVQHVTPAEEACFPLAGHDLRRHVDPITELNRLMTLEADAAFDLQTGPLIRGCLIRLAEDEHVLLITMHHIVSDGWSMSILMNELSTLYGAFLRGENDPLPALQIQYADYAVWQRHWMEGDILQRQMDYWKTVLAGAPVLLDLPADHPRPAQRSYAGSFAEFQLDEQLTAGLRQLSQRHGTTLHMTLLAAWAALLGRLSGQQDVVIGTPTANRGRAEIEGLIGFFVNTLALRLDLSGAPTGAELLAQARTQAIAAQQHQDIPFEQVVELIQPVRSLAHSPLFQVMFAWYGSSGRALELPDLELLPLQGSPHRISKFDLTLSLQETGSVISGGVEYATALFEPDTARRYLGYFQTLLQGMIADDSLAVNRLPILPAAEREQVLYGWNATGTEFRAERCVHELFEEQVERTPEATALVFQDEELSYRELNVRANGLAHYLSELGVKPDERVAICVERSFEMVIAVLAVLKAGGAYVPLDPAYPLERLQFMVEDSEPVAVLTQKHLAGVFTAGSRPERVVLMLDDKVLAWNGYPATNLDCTELGLNSSHLAYVIYTSGSTGTPKGVMVQHRSIVNRLVWMQAAYELDTQDVVLQKTPFGFDVSVWEFFWPLLYGARLVMARPEGHKNPTYLTEIIQRNKITTIHFVPSMLEGFLEHAGVFPDCPLTRVICSGEALSTMHLKCFREQFPQATLYNLYGPTEASVDVTAWTCSLSSERATVPIGKPIANTQIYILDSYGEPVPIGVSGELYIGGTGVARGYLNRPELTAERFVSDPFSSKPAARMYRTGDLGRWLPDGNIEFLGRNDDQVKIRGFRIELGEIEAKLSAYPGLREAVVVAREDTPGDKRLVAYYISTKEEETFGADSLRFHLQQMLPEYMVPAAYVRLESMPLTPNGKLDRKALPVPDAEAYVVRGYEAPQGEMEVLLAEAFAEVLGVERVGRHDNFFELGGHSLLIIRLLSRIRSRRMQVDIRSLFQTPAVMDLAATMVETSPQIQVPPNLIPAESSVILPEMLSLVSLTAEQIASIVACVPGGASNVQDIYPLAPLQEGIFFHHLMTEHGDPYLLSSLLAFDTRQRLDAYLEAMQAIVNRHDVLRTAILWEGLPDPMQVVLRRVTLPVEEVELDGKGDVEEQLYARVDPRRIRLDLRHAPLLCLYAAYDSTQNRWLLLMVQHHITEDMTSLMSMQVEVQAHLLKRGDDLPVSVPFRNYVAQARLGMGKEEHEAFFRRMLGDVDVPTAPFGLLEVQSDGTETAEANLKLPGLLSLRMRENARRFGVSTASLCHLAWAKVLAKVSGREDVVFGTVLFGRMQGEEGIDRALGLYINTLPIRINVGSEEVLDGLRKTHLLLAELLQHEHASLALAQRCSAVPAPAPLFSALLNYRYNAETASSSSHEALQNIKFLRGEERTNYPFYLAIDDMGDGFWLTMQTASSIDPARVCAFVETALDSLIGALEASPQTLLGQLEVLPEGKREDFLYGWNAAAMECSMKLPMMSVSEPSAHASTTYVAPKGEAEILLAQAFAEVLGLDRVGREDNFFVSGGNSLLIMRLLSLLRNRGRHLNIRDLFCTPTVMDLAATL